MSCFLLYSQPLTQCLSECRLPNVEQSNMCLDLANVSILMTSEMVDFLKLLQLTNERKLEKKNYSGKMSS